jgi:acyl-coenzyme A synthetase/AMP-(fatty) acid ligase
MKEKFKGEWCMTGDMGFADDEGYIYFEGRGDDVIKSFGYRVGPAELEAKILEVEAVASCAVVGVPDPQRGQAIKAFVKVMPGTPKIRDAHPRDPGSRQEETRRARISARDRVPRRISDDGDGKNPAAGSARAGGSEETIISSDANRENRHHRFSPGRR